MMIQISEAIILLLIVIVFLVYIAESDKGWTKRFSKHALAGVLFVARLLCMLICFGFLEYFTKFPIWMSVAISIPAGLFLFFVIVLLHGWSDNPRK
jgi:heme A synthase